MIGLYLMTQKGIAVLDAMTSESPKEIDWVVVGRDANNADDRRVEILEKCGRLGIEVFERNEEPPNRPKYLLAISWRWLIDPGESTLIVIHDSLLPKYRGFNPLVTSLINGDTEVGATALLATVDYDRGDIIAQSASKISYPITIQEATTVVCNNYSELALDILRPVSAGDAIVGEPQDERNASYSVWRDADDFRIDWASSSQKIRRQIDAQSFPYSGSVTSDGSRDIKILKAREVGDVNIANRDVGKTLFVNNGRPTIICGKGLLEVVSARYVDTSESVVPVKRFRTRYR